MEKVNTTEIVKNFFEEFPDATILLYGPRRSGKTWFLNSLLPKIKKQYKRIYIFKNTVLEDQDVYDGFKVQKMENRVLKKIITVAKTISKKKTSSYPMLLIFDDVLSTVDIETKKMLQDIAQEGRHINISCIFATQTLRNVITPSFRDNMDMSIFAKPRGSASRFIFDNYFRATENEDKFKELLSEQDKYEKIVLNHQTGKIDIG